MAKTSNRYLEICSRCVDDSIREAAIHEVKIPATQDEYLTIGRSSTTDAPGADDMELAADSSRETICWADSSESFGSVPSSTSGTSLKDVGDDDEAN